MFSNIIFHATSNFNKIWPHVAIRIRVWGSSSVAKIYQQHSSNGKHTIWMRCGVWSPSNSGACGRWNLNSALHLLMPTSKFGRNILLLFHALTSTTDNFDLVSKARNCRPWCRVRIRKSTLSILWCGAPNAKQWLIVLLKGLCNPPLVCKLFVMTCQTLSNLLYNIYTIFLQILCKIFGVQGSNLWITLT